METYLVGGAVRDILLGHEPKDKDYVVVGSDAQEMLSLGFSQVGADFPVFLHPETKEEYALARYERKVGVGYLGFETHTGKEVTLEDDLLRRDLTINAMAMTSKGELVDPYQGQADLQNKVLRHTSIAFSEDPVRVLRVARFLARFGPDWTVAPETWELALKMVQAGELHHLTAERVWKEVQKGLSEAHPHLMVKAFKALGLFELPSFADYVLRDEVPDVVPEGIPVRFALFFGREFGKQEGQVIPSLVKTVASRFTSLSSLDYAALSKEAKLEVIKRNCLVRQEEPAQQVFQALQAQEWAGYEQLSLHVQALKTVKAAKVLEGIDPKDVSAIQKAIAAAELAVIQ